MVVYLVDNNDWTTSTYYNSGTSSGDSTCTYIDPYDYGWSSTSYTYTEELILPILFTKLILVQRAKDNKQQTCKDQQNSKILF
jgi:hypothetical protein